MNKVKIAYWVVTGLLSVFLLGGAIGDIMLAEQMVTSLAKLGIPAYLLPFFGVMKIMAVIAILTPQLGRLREGAYAGLLFYAIGAIYVHIAGGDPVAQAAGATVLLLLVLASYFTSLQVKGLHKS